MEIPPVVFVAMFACKSNWLHFEVWKSLFWIYLEKFHVDWEHGPASRINTILWLHTSFILWPNNVWQIRSCMEGMNADLLALKLHSWCQCCWLRADGRFTNLMVLYGVTTCISDTTCVSTCLFLVWISTTGLQCLIKCSLHWRNIIPMYCESHHCNDTKHAWYSHQFHHYIQNLEVMQQKNIQISDSCVQPVERINKPHHTNGVECTLILLRMGEPIFEKAKPRNDNAKALTLLMGSRNKPHR